jgi:hypothetical protein
MYEKKKILDFEEKKGVLWRICVHEFDRSPFPSEPGSLGRNDGGCIWPQPAGVFTRNVPL